MGNNENWVVDGYLFGSLEDAELAQAEKNKIDYLNKHMEEGQPQKVITVYNRLVADKIFKTPIGWGYMHELQGRLLESGIAADQLQNIPLYTVFSHREEPVMPIRQRIKPAKVKPDYRIAGFRTAVTVSIVMAVLVILLFLIALKSPNPNAVNYEKVIQNKYAAWEQELTDREAVVREKEKTLNIEE